MVVQIFLKNLFILSFNVTLALFLFSQITAMLKAEKFKKKVRMKKVNWLCDPIFNKVTGIETNYNQGIFKIIYRPARI